METSLQWAREYFFQFDYLKTAPSLVSQEWMLVKLKSKRVIYFGSFFFPCEFSHDIGIPDLES